MYTKLMHENSEILGILFTGGEGPQKQKLKKIFGSLQEGTIIAAADSGLFLAKKARLEPHWIIGDMDSLGKAKFFNDYSAETVIRYPVDKDLTDTELALNLLWEKGCSKVWIFGGGGGRTDHLFGIRDLFERERFPNRWLTAAEDIYCINEADRLLVKAKEATLVSVFPLGNGPWKAKSCGLKWPLDNVEWKRGYYGLSNIATENEIEVTVIHGRFMIIFTGDLCQQQ